MSIPRLEPTRQFIDRLILLNRFHAPDQEDYSEAMHVLGLIHRDFPIAPVHQQAAYLMARLSVERPFQEGNFRTAWDYVADLLAHRGYDLRASYLEAQDLGNRVWEWIGVPASDAARSAQVIRRAPADGPGSHRDEAELVEDLVRWFRPRIHALH